MDSVPSASKAYSSLHGSWYKGRLLLPGKEGDFHPQPFGAFPLVSRQTGDSQIHSSTEIPQVVPPGSHFQDLSLSIIENCVYCSTVALVPVARHLVLPLPFSLYLFLSFSFFVFFHTTDCLVTPYGAAVKRLAVLWWWICVAVGRFLVHW